MPDTTHDIDALLEYLGLIAIPESPRYYIALTALVAERNRLRAELVSKADELAAAIKERDGYLEGNKQTLRALAEANEIAARYKQERDEAHGLIRKWRINLMDVVDDGDIMYAMTSDGRCSMNDADRRAFIEATRKEGGGA